MLFMYLLAIWLVVYTQGQVLRSTRYGDNLTNMHRFRERHCTKVPCVETIIITNCGV